MTETRDVRIEIWDDDPGKSGEWKESLTDLLRNTGYEVEAPDLLALESKLKCLEERRKQSRKGIVPEEDDSVVDNIDVLFLDYDLLDLSDHGYFLTGNEAAYLARAFSRVGYIVVLNQFGIDQFDLSMVRDFASKGDLDIGDSQVASRGLWMEPFSSFRPWHWPLFPWQAKAQRRREAEVIGALDDEVPILTFLGFERPDIRSLDPAVLSYLTGRNAENRDPATITFRDFVFDSGNGLERRDAEALAAKEGTNALVARISAARVHKWLDRIVLGTQDPLIDAPHLTERLPGVLKGDLQEMDTWSKTVLLDGAGLSEILKPRLHDYRFKRTDWVSRPAFWWSRIAEDSELIEDWPDLVESYVFLEDCSRFSAREDAREFVSDLAGLHSRRYVSKEPIPGVNYSPGVRLAM